MPHPEQKHPDQVESKETGKTPQLSESKAVEHVSGSKEASKAARELFRKVSHHAEKHLPNPTIHDSKYIEPNHEHGTKFSDYNFKADGTNKDFSWTKSKDNWSSDKDH